MQYQLRGRDESAYRLQASPPPCPLSSPPPEPTQRMRTCDQSAKKASAIELQDGRHGVSYSLPVM